MLFRKKVSSIYTYVVVKVDKSWVIFIVRRSSKLCLLECSVLKIFHNSRLAKKIDNKVGFKEPTSFFWPSSEKVFLLIWRYLSMSSSFWAIFWQAFHAGSISSNQKWWNISWKWLLYQIGLSDSISLPDKCLPNWMMSRTSYHKSFKLEANFLHLTSWLWISININFLARDFFAWDRLTSFLNLEKFKS